MYLFNLQEHLEHSGLQSVTSHTDIKRKFLTQLKWHKRIINYESLKRIVNLSHV